MLSGVVHRSPPLRIIREKQVSVDSVIKVKRNLVLVILTDVLLQLIIVAKFVQMLLLLVLLYDLSAYFALGRIPIALHGMCGHIERLYHDFAVWTQHRLIVLIVALYFRIL